MVKKPNVRQEQFQLVKKQIEFWDNAIALDKEMLKHDRECKNKVVRKLLELQKRYTKQ